MEQQNISSPTPNDSSKQTSSQNQLEQQKAAFAEEIRNFRDDKINKLRIINHWWNIILTVSGITFTLLVTVLGVVESKNENFNKWMKFSIGFSGAAAVASQSANSEFRVRSKAKEYTLAEARTRVLEHQILNAKTEEELEKCHKQYCKLVMTAAQAEISTDEDDETP